MGGGGILAGPPLVVHLTAAASVHGLGALDLEDVGGGGETAADVGGTRDADGQRGTLGRCLSVAGCDSEVGDTSNSSAATKTTGDGPGLGV